VRDSAGCEILDTVTVSTQVSTTTSSANAFVSIAPNPGQGIYQITASFNSKEVFVPFVIITASGESLLYGSVTRYSDVYRHELSFTAFLPGLYYIIFTVGQERVVRKIIKTN
jgi:hypothetical protein